MPITSQVSGQPVYFTSSGTVDTYSNGHAEGVIQTSHTGPEHSSSTHYIISDDNRIIANGYVSEGFCDSGTGFANWSADNVSGNILMQTETTVSAVDDVSCVQPHGESANVSQGTLSADSNSCPIG